MAPGILAGLAAFGIGLVLSWLIPGASPTPAVYVDFDRWPPPVHAHRNDDPAHRRLLVIGVCQIIALAVALLWAVFHGDVELRVV